MGNIGSGAGTSYPTALDTQTAVEVDSPAAGKTLARAAVPNDLAAAVLAIEGVLGLQPQGNLATVVAFLQKEHGTDGTHQKQITMSAGSASAPQLKSASDATGLFFPANVLGFSVAGVEVGRLSAGDLLIGGTYSPTIQSPTNCSSVSLSGGSYIRVGKVVTCTGQIQLTVTTALTSTSFTLTAPSSTFSSGAGCGFSGKSGASAQSEAVPIYQSGGVMYFGGNNLWYPVVNGTHYLYFTFNGVLA